MGESGSGKSQTAFALMGLLAANGTVEGSAIFEGKELVNLPKAELNKIRAEQISMIFQDPMTSLNPYMKSVNSSWKFYSYTKVMINKLPLLSR